MSNYKPIGTMYSDLMKIQGALQSKQPLYQAAQLVQRDAKNHATGRYSTGHLRNSIMIGFTEQPGQLTAHVGTNVEYALYFEMGTGPKGQASHEGISPEAHPIYRQTPWWVHESQVDRDAADNVYHWFHIDTDEGRFYKVTGQPASPFLYPALKDNEQKVVRLLADGYQKEIKRRVK